MIHLRSKKNTEAKFHRLEIGPPKLSVGFAGAIRSPRKYRKE